MDPRNAIFDRAREQIARQMKSVMDEQRRIALSKRIECVHHGAKAYQEKRIVDSATYYMQYVRLLEEAKNVGEGGLTPSNFDPSKEMGELLLLSGVYWDLTKIFDLTTSEAKKKEFLHYLEKFVLFSKGTGFQALCAEGLRRYLHHSRPRHQKELANAYRLLGDGKCYIVTALVDVTEPETLPALWNFRDEVLAKSFMGRCAIRGYYRVGPGLARFTNQLPRSARQGLGRVIDGIARLCTRD